MYAVQLTGLRKAFGKSEVLRGVDLAIPDGAFVAILGPSGCGKSTLLRLVAGLETPSAGRIDIHGVDVVGVEPMRRGCAMVFQNYALYPHMSVAENIAYALRVAGASRAERRRRAEETARLLKLDGLLDRKPAELSGGQRQRVAIARALIRSPRVFLFDEPLSNLDAELRVQLRHEVRRIHEEVGATSIFVTHDQIEAMTLADILVVMRDGAIQQTGAPAEVYDQPANLYVAQFIGSPSMGLLEGTLDVAAGGVRLADGQVLDVDTPPAGARDGGAIIVGIRPEALRLGVDGRGVAATVRFSEELGAARLHHLTIAGSLVTLATNDRRELGRGEGVTVTAPSAEIRFFDPVTGNRLQGREKAG